MNNTAAGSDFKYSHTISDFPTAGSSYTFSFNDNESIPLLTHEYCNHISMVGHLDECFRMQDTLSWISYNTIYTPMLPHASLDDYYATRTSTIRYLQQRYGYESYLEIGCGDFTNFRILSDLFMRSDCIDPFKPELEYNMTSDAFFDQAHYHNLQLEKPYGEKHTDTMAVAREKFSYDVVFIDGLHDARQVLRDVENAVRLLNKNGIVAYILDI